MSTQIHPVRLLHLSNDILLVGFVAEYDDTGISVRSPYILEVNVKRFDSDWVAADTEELFVEEGSREVTDYGFHPYLDQLSNATRDFTVLFPMSNIVSVSIPADHLVRNYSKIIAFKQNVKQEKPLYDASYHSKRYH